MEILLSVIKTLNFPYFVKAQKGMHFKTKTVPLPTNLESQPQIILASYVICELSKP